MGYTSYDTTARFMRSLSQGYQTKSINDLFEQNTKRQVHESLNPRNLRKRECFDSPQHPNTLAVIVALDVTGSMGKIPHMLIKDGLPHIMGTIIEKGSPDVAVCFTAVGDHLRDEAPFQAGQFESGDLELDTHLKNTWLEGNGGGNGGESYALPWYFAAYHTSIDCYNKRGEKGVLFTIGDENIHREYSRTSLRSIFGDTAVVETDKTASELLEEAQKYYHVYHFGLPSSHSMDYWKEILGENFISISSHEQIPNKIAEIVLKHTATRGKDYVEQPPAQQLNGSFTKREEPSEPKVEIFL